MNTDTGKKYEYFLTATGYLVNEILYKILSNPNYLKVGIILKLCEIEYERKEFKSSQ